MSKDPKDPKKGPKKELTTQDKRILEELARRRAEVKKLDWDRLMFPKQRAFIEDPARLKVACCSRRAGKSHGIALALLKAAYDNPGSFPIYMNMNKASAKVILWPALRDLKRLLNLDIDFDNVTSNIKVNDVESVITVYGVGSRREMDKARGGKPPAIALDEAQNMGSDMLYLINEILLPSTIDYKAPIMITGTPSNARHSPFYRISQGMGLTDDSQLGWSTHHWTMFDNPHIKDPEEEIQLALDANPGWTTETPAFRREYLGEWVFDSQSRAFTFPKDFALVPHFPKDIATDWRYILGVDLGTKDPCAFTVLAFSRTAGKTFVLESYRQHLTVLQAGTEIERLMHRYPTFSSIVVDSGGQGAAFVRQWKETHPHIPAKPVKKGMDSVDMGISLINADIAAGKVYFVTPTCTDLLQEMETVQWDDRALAMGKRVIRIGDNDHAVDSFRYAYTKVRTHSTTGFQELIEESPFDRIMRERREKELHREPDTRAWWEKLAKGWR